MGPGGPTLGLSVRKKPRHLRVNKMKKFALTTVVYLYQDSSGKKFERTEVHEREICSKQLQFITSGVENITNKSE